MDDRLIDEEAIHSYQPGRIRGEDELSAELDERMLADPEFSLVIDVIEDDILEEYVDGELTAADIAAVNNHFLVPPERQRKLQRMRLISRRLSGAAYLQVGPISPIDHEPVQKRHSWGKVG